MGLLCVCHFMPGNQVLPKCAYQHVLWTVSRKFGLIKITLSDRQFYSLLKELQMSLYLYRFYQGCLLPS